MTLLQDIQSDLINPGANIANVLRKCKVLASRLGNENFDNWLERELNGYSDEDELPAYRVLHVQSFGHFVGMFYAQVKNAPIPPSCFPEKYQEMVRIVKFRESISHFEALLQGTKTGEPLQCHWSAELIRLVCDTVYKNYTLQSAWQLIPYGTIAALVDTVRNRVLSFVLEIEKSNPDAGEAPISSKPVPLALVQQVFNTFIAGNVGSMSSGNLGTQICVIRNDFESLKSYLLSIKVLEEDIEELRSALVAEKKAQGAKPVAGERCKGWIEKMVTKAKSGAWQVSVAAAGELLSKAILAYLGTNC